MRLAPTATGVAIVSVFLALVASGCGSSSKSGALRSMTDRNQAFGGADSAQFQKLSACLRKHGVNGFGSFRNPSGQRPRTGTTPNRRPTFTPARQTKQMKAFAACRKLLPSSGFGPRGGNPNRQGASPFQPSS